mmetsp:Transcript_3287/g.5511  ORF Transcript_3287/g.5511 Transcript_3287/m.5511 type:complete len:328 (+) Transcript_3287:64-1047(+)
MRILGQFLMVASLWVTATSLLRSPLKSKLVQSRALVPRTYSSKEGPIDEITIPSGLCAVYKPQGWSSNDVVTKVKNIIRSEYTNRTGNKIKLKVGHGGTLDPLAEGVLVLGIGSGTKLLGDYLAGSKGYRANVLLGTATDTLDSTGNVTATVDCSHIAISHIADGLQNFRGDIQQMPPMYSALKRDGKKLYELAREGIEVERKLRNVTVYNLNIVPVDTNQNVGDNTLTGCNDSSIVGGDSLDVSSYGPLPVFGLDVECSGGFYVRTLIDDLCQSINGAGHMTGLVRTKQGQFMINDCLPREKWKFDNLCEHTLLCSEKAGITARTS